MRGESASHGIAATTAIAAQAPRPQRQPPSASESGTVSTSAAVSPIESAVV